MNETKNKIVKLLWDFQSLREEHIEKICNCTRSDIDVLIANKVLVRDKTTGLIRHKAKQMNNRNAVVFDVVMEYLERIPEIKKGKHPVNVTLKTRYISYDIIAIKEEEMDKLFNEIDIVSKSDKIIIIIETKNYIKRPINTTRECYICTYPPIDIVDKLN